MDGFHKALENAARAKGRAKERASQRGHERNSSPRHQTLSHLQHGDQSGADASGASTLSQLQRGMDASGLANEGIFTSQLLLLLFSYLQLTLLLGTLLLALLLNPPFLALLLDPNHHYFHLVWPHFLELAFLRHLHHLALRHHPAIIFWPLALTNNLRLVWHRLLVMATWQQI